MLAVPDGSGCASFGAVVAIDGDTVLIGAPHNPNLDTVGRAFVFARSGEQWLQQGPALRSGLALNDEFGGAVALSGDTALIGAQSSHEQQGAAYVFVRSAGKWQQQGPPFRPLRPEAANVGSAVALQGDRAVVAARSAVHGVSPRSGALFLYVRSGGVWSQQGPGEPVADEAEDLAVGQSVGLSGNDVLVGALGIQQGHGAAFALRACDEPGACQFFDPVGAAGDDGSLAGDGGDSGAGGVGSAGGGASGGSSGVAGSATGGAIALGTAGRAGSDARGGFSAGGASGVPSRATSGACASDSCASDAASEQTVSACGCRLGARSDSSAYAWAVLVLFVLSRVRSRQSK